MNDFVQLEHLENVIDSIGGTVTRYFPSPLLHTIGLFSRAQARTLGLGKRVALSRSSCVSTTWTAEGARELQRPPARGARTAPSPP